MPKSNQRLIESLWKKAGRGQVPPKLRRAAESLVELCNDADGVFGEALCNDPSTDYPAILAVLEICKIASPALMENARAAVVNEMKFHDSQVKTLKNLGVSYGEAA